MFSLVNDNFSIDDHGVDAFGVLRGFGVSGQGGERLRIENNNVCLGALGENAALFEA